MCKETWCDNHLELIEIGAFARARAELKLQDWGTWQYIAEKIERHFEEQAKKEADNDQKDNV